MKKLKPVTMDCTPKMFAHLGEQIEYVANTTRPDIAFNYASMTQTWAETADALSFKLLNSTLDRLQQRELGLVLPKLDIQSTSIRGYSDAGFANNGDLNSQLSKVVVLIDKFGNAALIHYVSCKSRRFVRSILAAEVYALASCRDFCQILAHDLFQIIGRKFPVFLSTDSKSTFDTITKLSGVSEKRLLIDISCLRQSYCEGEIQNLGHVRSKFNLADALTKKTNSETLQNLIKSGILDHPINLWIIHKTQLRKNTLEKK